MYQFMFSTAFAIVGIILGALACFFAASTWTSFSDFWTFTVFVFPVLGIAYGCAVGAKVSNGQEPYPIVSSHRRWLFSLWGGLLCAIGGYIGFIVISSIWNNKDFWVLLFCPSDVPSLSSTSRGHSTEYSLLVQVIICGVLGAYCINKEIREGYLTL